MHPEPPEQATVNKIKKIEDERITAEMIEALDWARKFMNNYEKRKTEIPLPLL